MDDPRAVGLCRRHSSASDVLIWLKDEGRFRHERRRCLVTVDALCWGNGEDAGGRLQIRPRGNEQGYACPYRQQVASLHARNRVEPGMTPVSSITRAPKLMSSGGCAAFRSARLDESNLESAPVWVNRQFPDVPIIRARGA